MTVPQIKNSALMVILIWVGIPMLSCVHLYAIGELHGWKDMWDAMDHAFFAAFMASLTWILFKSPLAPIFKQLVMTDNTVKTDPSGAVVSREQTTKVTINEAPPTETSPRVVGAGDGK